MARIVINRFGGQSPRTGKRLLNDRRAQRAINCKLWSGELRPWREPAETVRFPNSNPPQTLHLDRAGFWLRFDEDVDIAPGPLPGEARERIYISGLGAPKITDAAAVAEAELGGGETVTRMLGVPAPDAPPTAAPRSPLGDEETTAAAVDGSSRAYVFTFVNADGEEGPPSPPSRVIDVPPGGQALVTELSGPPSFEPGDDPRIAHKRIYRTQTGSSGSATFRFAGRIAVEETRFVDRTGDIDLGEALPSATWSPPPADLQGLIVLPNGVLAGFRENEVCFSEPFFPHAWPEAYRLALEYPIRGLGVFGTTVMAATTSYPYLITGSDPAAASMSRIPARQPCVSKRGLVSSELGVVYPSPDGLYIVGPGGGSVATRSIMTRDEWQAFRPETIHAEVHDGRYFAFYGDEKNGGGFALDKTEPEAELTLLDLYAHAAFSDAESDSLYLAFKRGDDSTIELWEGRETMLRAVWTSKAFELPGRECLSAARLSGDFPPRLSQAEQDVLAAERQAVIDANAADLAAGGDPAGALAGAALNVFPVAGDGLSPVPAAYAPPAGARFRLRVDGEIRADKEIVSERPFRLPAGYRGREVEMEIETDFAVREASAASSMEELGGGR